jgi:GAF domain-containing protein
MLPSLSVEASPGARSDHHEEIHQHIQGILDDRTDWIAAMATVSCELHHAFDYFDWTGFYRVVAPEQLMVGPYQGTHGCLHIPFSRGVCGAAARSKEAQFVPDVHAFDDHIACSSTTASELVVPVLTPDNRLLAVLDVDSDTPAAFDPVDQEQLENLCRMLGRQFAPTALE